MLSIVASWAAWGETEHDPLPLITLASSLQVFNTRAKAILGGGLNTWSGQGAVKTFVVSSSPGFKICADKIQIKSASSYVT